MELKGLENNCREVGNFCSSVIFQNDFNKKTRKKVSRDNIFKISEQAAFLMGMDLLQMALVLGKEIDELKDEDLQGQNKFDLLLGDLEAMAVGLKNEFDKKYDKKYNFKKKHDIDDLKNRVSHWTLRTEVEEKETN